jgi:hypothetical protein
MGNDEWRSAVIYPKSVNGRKPEFAGRPAPAASGNEKTRIDTAVDAGLMRL